MRNNIFRTITAFVSNVKMSVKSNFSLNEIRVVKKNLPLGTSMSINKCGNIAIRHEKAPSNIFFNIYKKRDGYILRKRLSVAKGIANVGGIMNGGKPFEEIQSLMNYLNYYNEKYPTRMWSRVRDSK